MRAAAGLTLGALSAGAFAQADTIKIGLIPADDRARRPSTGRQIDAAVKLYLAQNGATVAGKKIEVIVKDDAGVADTTRPRGAGNWW